MQKRDVRPQETRPEKGKGKEGEEERQKVEQTTSRSVLLLLRYQRIPVGRTTIQAYSKQTYLHPNVNMHAEIKSNAK
jgi:hypothetical protein